MKKLANLKGAKALNRKQQKEIVGGEQATDLNGNPISGGNWWCGCTMGDNVPAIACSSAVCDISCLTYFNGLWNGVCIS